jgi:hypothetical protein
MHAISISLTTWVLLKGEREQLLADTEQAQQTFRDLLAAMLRLNVDNPGAVI